MSDKKIIFEDSPEAAEQVTVTLWKSLGGFLYNKEKDARWASATHYRCACGNAAKKPYLSCDECRSKAEKNKYERLELVEWDEETPLVEYNNDKYFYCYDDVFFYCEDLEIDISDLMLVVCEKGPSPFLDPDDFGIEHLPEDHELSDKIKIIIGKFNLDIEENWPEYWVPGNKRVSLK